MLLFGSILRNFVGYMYGERIRRAEGRGRTGRSQEIRRRGRPQTQQETSQEVSAGPDPTCRSTIIPSRTQVTQVRVLGTPSTTMMQSKHAPIPQ